MNRNACTADRGFIVPARFTLYLGTARRAFIEVESAPARFAGRNERSVLLRVGLIDEANQRIEPDRPRIRLEWLQWSHGPQKGAIARVRQRHG